MPYHEPLQPCPYNKAARCFPSKRNCDACGWNPEVAKARLKAMGIDKEEKKVEE